MACNASSCTGPIITRKEAKSLGLKRYFTGKSCINGHICERQTRASICEICSKEKPKIVFDHDHSTGSFRGWICDECNKVLGLVKDDILTLISMVDYLRNSSVKINNQEKKQYSDIGVCGSKQIISNQRSEPRQGSTFYG